MKTTENGLRSTGRSSRLRTSDGVGDEGGRASGAHDVASRARARRTGCRRRPSRRLRPVRARNTSSRVGRVTSAAAPAAGAASGRAAGRAAAPGRPGPGSPAGRRARRLRRAGRLRRPGRPRAAAVGSPSSPTDRSPASSALSRFGRVVGDDLAVVDDDHPLGDGVGLVQVVGGEHDRGAVRGTQRSMTCSCRLARFCGSSPVDGSSRNSRSGAWTMPIAMSRRRRWPPDSVADRAVGDVARSSEAISSSARPRRLAPAASRRRGPG